MINDIKENYVENERNKNEGEFKLRYGTHYLYETMIYLENIKKIKIFSVIFGQKEIKIVKAFKDKDDLVKDSDKKEARIMLGRLKLSQNEK